MYELSTTVKRCTLPWDMVENSIPRNGYLAHPFEKGPLGHSLGKLQTVVMLCQQVDPLTRAGQLKWCPRLSGM